MTTGAGPACGSIPSSETLSCAKNGRGPSSRTRIGTLAIVGGCSRIPQDVPPYFIAEGNPVAVRGVNIVGLRRADVPAAVRLNLQRAYKILYRSGLAPASALERIRSEVESSAEMEHLCEFIASSKRGIC